MTEILVKKVVEREPGYLYFVDKSGNVCRALMLRGRKKKDVKK